MRHFSRTGIVFCVPPDHARLTIVFDLQADPIGGVVCDGAGDLGAPFAGWMELTRAIERTLDAARQVPRAGLRSHDLLHEPTPDGPDDVSY
jgi:hypothetical protein